MKNETNTNTLNLHWSAPEQVKTVRGVRNLETATPTPTFWAAWRRSKAELQAQGISCRPTQDGAWQVVRWSEVSTVVSSAVETSASEASPVGAVRTARLAQGFHAAELDPSRKWSDEQRAIFNWFRTPDTGRRCAVVVARAGTGKTTTIVAAFSQAPEEDILYAVFNKKNQREAEGKIKDTRVDVRTLHSVGYRIIRSVWHNAKPDEGVERDRALGVAGASAPDEVVGAITKLVGFAKNLLVHPTAEDLREIADERDVALEGWEAQGWNLGRVIDCALQVLALSLQRDPQGRISFDDMVWLPVAAGWLRGMYDLVCVDEAQDMNLPQLLMAKGIVREGGRICVVGDDRQAIYGFRGAASGGIEMMRQELNGVVLGLTTTYRCPKAVVTLAAALVPDYKAAPEAPEGVANNVGTVALAQLVKIGDAVLSRKNAPLMPLCLGLLKKGVPARIEGRDIGKQLAGIVDRLKARSVPHFISRVEAWVEKQIARFGKTKNAEAKTEQIRDQAGVLLAVAENAASVAEIKQRLLDLFQDTDGNSRPSVVLSSVHKAKGLEWDRVFLLSSTFRVTSGEGEEANIYYVALTRAKRELNFVGGDVEEGRN